MFNAGQKVACCSALGWETCWGLQRDHFPKRVSLHAQKIDCIVDRATTTKTLVKFTFVDGCQASPQMEILSGAGAIGPHCKFVQGVGVELG